MFSFSFNIIVEFIVYMLLVSRAFLLDPNDAEHTIIPIIMRNANYYASNTPNNAKINTVIECMTVLISYALRGLLFFSE